LVKTGSISEVADAIRRDHHPDGGNKRLGNTVLLTGAGCSRSAGVPLAAEIAQKLSLRLAVRYNLVDQEEQRPEEAVSRLVSSDRYSSACLHDGIVKWDAVYEEVFTRHYRSPKETRAIFSEILDDREISMNWAHLCIGELVRLGYLSTVLTTNFDQLALEGIARSGRLPVVADGVESLNRIMGQPTYPQLIQIHGSRHTYRLRNSSDDVNELASDGGAKHAIDELMRAAAVFIVVGYGGKENGLMSLLTEGASRFPDTQIFWVSYEKEIENLGDLPLKLLNTSRYSRVLLRQDADRFFHSLLQEMGLNAPKIIEDPLFGVENLKVSLTYSENAEIDSIIDGHMQKVEQIQAIFDPHAIGRQRISVDVAGNRDARVQAIERLATGMANDFNNVLTATLGYSDLLLVRHPNGDPSHDDIISIRQSAERAASLVNRLLAFASNLKLKPQRTDLNKIVGDISDDLKHFVADNVVVRVDISPRVWAVWVDPDEIENIVISLVKNASESISDYGEISVRVYDLPSDTRSKQEIVRTSDTVVIEVEDTGSGIDPNLGDRIFDPYFTTKGPERSGMGLSAVKGIVRQSGGEISFESVFGQGSTFRVHFPKHNQISKSWDSAGITTEASPARSEVKRRTVLYVEDEPSVRDFTVRILQQLGFLVFQAGGGSEAIRLYQTLKEELSLVISDMVMPHGDGPSVLRELRSRGYKGPFIMSSGYAEDVVREILSEDLATMFLPKPYTMQQVQEATERVLGRT